MDLKPIQNQVEILKNALDNQNTKIKNLKREFTAEKGRLKQELEALQAKYQAQSEKLSNQKKTHDEEKQFYEQQFEAYEKEKLKTNDQILALKEDLQKWQNEPNGA